MQGKAYLVDINSVDQESGILLVSKLLFEYKTKDCSLIRTLVDSDNHNDNLTKVLKHFRFFPVGKRLRTAWRAGEDSRKPSWNFRLGDIDGI